MAALKKYPPKDAAAKIEQLAAQGYAQVGIAKEFGVAASTLKRWMEEDESLREAFDVGREAERRELHGLIKRDAVAGKQANANAMFLLKCRHGYREQDTPGTKVDVAVNVPQPVLLVRDYGTDEEWAAKAAEQQRKLVSGEPLTIPARLPAPQNASQTSAPPVGDASPTPAPVTLPAPIYTPAWTPPALVQTEPAR